MGDRPGEFMRELSVSVLITRVSSPDLWKPLWSVSGLRAIEQVQLFAILLPAFILGYIVRRIGCVKHVCQVILLSVSLHFIALLVPLRHICVFDNISAQPLNVDMMIERDLVKLD